MSDGWTLGQEPYYVGLLSVLSGCPRGHVRTNVQLVHFVRNVRSISQQADV
jgi:hypothetical protein